MENKENKEKSITIRLGKDLHQQIINKAIEASVKEGKIVKISEIIRIALENLVK
jgi:hypothetical protein